MRLFSDPNHILILGFLLTALGAIVTGYGTVRSSAIQAKEQTVLREKSDEIASLNREIADSQRILREKAETQTQMQRQLAEKSDENALLNSQMANLQRDLREKSEAQLESQHVLTEKLEENGLVSSQIANLQREQDLAIHEIKNRIVDIDNALKEQGVKAKTAERKDVTVQLQGVVAKASVGTIKVLVSSTNIIVPNGKIAHVFDSNLSILVKISTGRKGYPFLHAKLLSPGKNFGGIDTDQSGYSTTYERYTIKVNAISNEAADFSIHVNDIK